MTDQGWSDWHEGFPPNGMTGVVQVTTVVDVGATMISRFRWQRWRHEDQLLALLGGHSKRIVCTKVGPLRPKEGA